MANHISAKKRIRQTLNRKLYNNYYAKSVRNSIKNFREISKKEDANEKFSSLISSIDKLVKKGIIHKNKAANLKSKLTKKINKL
jgi:small subunit ribosomal protein S20